MHQQEISMHPEEMLTAASCWIMELAFVTMKPGITEQLLPACHWGTARHQLQP